MNWTEKVPKFELEADMPLQVGNIFGYLSKIVLNISAGLFGPQQRDYQDQVLHGYSDRMQISCHADRLGWFRKNIDVE